MSLFPKFESIQKGKDKKEGLPKDNFTPHAFSQGPEAILSNINDEQVSYEEKNEVADLENPEDALISKEQVEIDEQTKLKELGELSEDESGLDSEEIIKKRKYDAYVDKTYSKDPEKSTSGHINVNNAKYGQDKGEKVQFIKRGNKEMPVVEK